MRDAIGGAVNIVIIVVFIVIVLAYLAFNVNYTKASRMKNKIIATYEDYDAARGARDKAQPAKVMRIGEDKSMGVVEVTMPVNSTIELGFLPLYM